MAETTGHPAADNDDGAGESFFLALAASLILHLALIYGIEAGSPRPSAGKPAVLQARLAPQQTDKAVLTVPAAAKEKEAALPLTPAPATQKSLAAAETPRPATPPEKPSSLPVVDVPLPADPTYYPAKQLDVHPKPLLEIIPGWPDEAVTALLGGEVVLLLLIDEAGVVQETSVVEANPPGYFEASAREAFRHARFSPAIKNGRNVKSRVLIKVSYEIGSEGAVKIR